MDYALEMAKMLEHLDANRTPKNVSLLVKSCGFAIGQAAGMLKDMDSVNELLAAVFEAVRYEAYDAFRAEHAAREAEQAVSAEEFLREHFQPAPGDFNG